MRNNQTIGGIPAGSQLAGQTGLAVENPAATSVFTSDGAEVAAGTTYTEDNFLPTPAFDASDSMRELVDTKTGIKPGALPLSAVPAKPDLNIAELQRLATQGHPNIKKVNGVNYAFFWGDVVDHDTTYKGKAIIIVKLQANGVKIARVIKLYAQSFNKAFAAMGYDEGQIQQAFANQEKFVTVIDYFTKSTTMSPRKMALVASELDFLFGQSYESNNPVGALTVKSNTSAALTSNQEFIFSGHSLIHRRHDLPDEITVFPDIAKAMTSPVLGGANISGQMNSLIPDLPITPAYLAKLDATKHPNCRVIDGVPYLYFVAKPKRGDTDLRKGLIVRYTNGRMELARTRVDFGEDGDPRHEKLIADYFLKEKITSTKLKDIKSGLKFLFSDRAGVATVNNEGVANFSVGAGNIRFKIDGRTINAGFANTTETGEVVDTYYPLAELPLSRSWLAARHRGEPGFSHLTIGTKQDLMQEMRVQLLTGNKGSRIIMLQTAQSANRTTFIMRADGAEAGKVYEILERKVREPQTPFNADEVSPVLAYLSQIRDSYILPDTLDAEDFNRLKDFSLQYVVSGQELIARQVNREDDTEVVDEEIFSIPGVASFAKLASQSTKSGAAGPSTKRAEAVASPRLPFPKSGGIKDHVMNDVTPVEGFSPGSGLENSRIYVSPTHAVGVVVEFIPGSTEDLSACHLFPFVLGRQLPKTFAELLDGGCSFFNLSPSLSWYKGMRCTVKTSDGNMDIEIQDQGKITIAIHQKPDRFTPQFHALEDIKHDEEKYSKPVARLAEYQQSEDLLFDQARGYQFFTAPEASGDSIAFKRYFDGRVQAEWIADDERVELLALGPQGIFFSGVLQKTGERICVASPFYKDQQGKWKIKSNVLYVIKPIINFKELLRGAALKQLDAGLAEIRKNFPVKENPLFMAVRWPQVITSDEWLEVQDVNGMAIRLPASDAETWRKIFAGEKVSVRELQLQIRWGKNGASAHYALIWRASGKEGHWILVPQTESGAPSGEIRLSMSEKMCGMLFAGNSEIAEHLRDYLSPPVMSIIRQESELHFVFTGAHAKALKIIEATMQEILRENESLPSPYGCLQKRDLGENGYAIKIPEDKDEILILLAYTEKTAAIMGAALAQFQEKYLQNGALDWTREIKSYVRSAEAATPRNGGKLSLDIRQKTERGKVAYTVTRLRYCGESLGDQVFFTLNGKAITATEFSLHDGDVIKIVRDIPRQFWEDATYEFAQGAIIKKESHSYSYKDQVLFTATSENPRQKYLYADGKGTVVEDALFKISGEFYTDPRDPQQRVRAHELKLSLTADALAMGLSEKSVITCSHMPETLLPQSEVHFSVPGFGTVRMQLALQDDELVITRLAAFEDTLEVLEEKGEILISARNITCKLAVENRQGKAGTRSYQVVKKTDAEGILRLARISGSKVSLKEGEELAIEKNAAAESGEDVAGTNEIVAGNFLFVPIRRNRDGSRPIRNVYLRRREYLVMREALDGVGAHLAEGPELEQFDYPTPNYSVLAAMQLSPGENFLPTSATLAFIQNILGTNYNPDQDIWPFPDEYPLPQRLEFETTGGLVVSIPVRFRHRLRNPFEIDCYDYADPDTGGMIAGQKIETYLQGHPHTRRPVDAEVIYHEQGGAWRIYAMMADPQTGVHKAFTLALVHAKGIEEPDADEIARAKRENRKPRPSWVTFPGLFALTNISEIPTGINENEESLLRNEKIHRRNCLAALNKHLVAVYGNTWSANPSPVRMGRVRVEKSGDAAQLVFSSQDEPQADTHKNFCELSGIALDRSSRRLDFAETIILSEGIFVPRVDDKGAVILGVDKRTLYDKKITRERKFEHTLGQRRGIIRLTELTDTNNPEVYEWDLMTGTLTLLSAQQIPDDSEMGRSGREVLKILRNLNLGFLNTQQWNHPDQADNDAVGVRPFAALDFADSDDIAETDKSDNGVLLPLTHQIRQLTDPKEITRLMDIYDPHDLNAMPDVASVLTAMAGRQRENYVVTLPNGALIMIPVEERNEHPYDYVPHSRPDPVRGSGAAPANADRLMMRWLVPNPELKGSDDAPALRVSPYRGSRLTFCPHQKTVLQKVEEWLQTPVEPGCARTGTVAMPTGSGKTMVAAGVAEIYARLEKWREGDKICIFANQDDLMDQLISEFTRLFPDKKISRVQGKNPDFSGDIVVMSIPTISRRGFDLAEKMRAALKGKKMPLAIFDEWHHGEADSWQNVVQSLRAVQPDFVTIGFTATPRRTDPDIIIKLSIREQIKEKILPGGILIEVTGVPIRNLKKPADLDASSDLMSTARNRSMFEALEKHGAAKKGNPREFAATQITANSVAHAISMARYYQGHFGLQMQRDSRVRELKIGKRPHSERNIVILGESRGVSGIVNDTNTIQELINQHRNGAGEFQGSKIDTLVAVVSSDLSDEVLQLIFQAWREGTVETIFTAGLWLEGSDLNFVRNFVDGQATMSAQLEAQKKGRMQRYAPHEIDRELGRVVDEEKRVWIDVVDRLEGLIGERDNFRPLATMRDAFEIAHVLRGEVWDIRNNCVYREKPTHLELTPRALFHAKRLSGRGNAQIEAVFDGQDEHGKRAVRVFRLEQCITDSTYAGAVPASTPGRQVFGYHVVEKSQVNGAVRPVRNAGAGTKTLEEWIRVLGLDRPPTLVGVSINPGQFLLDDGTEVKLSLNKKTGDKAVYEVSGFLKKTGVSKTAEIQITRSDGTPARWRISRSRYHGSVLHVKDVANGQRFFMMVSRDGELMLWTRRRKEAEYLHMVSSPNKARDIRLDGREYAPREDSKGQLIYADSPTTREPEMDDTSPYLYSYKRVFGRQEGAGDRSSKEEALHELPAVRFKVGVDPGTNELIAAGMGPTAKEIATGAYFPFGAANEFDCMLDEEKWITPTGENKRGKVRLFFYRNEQAKVTGPDSMVRIAPYAMLEFDSREDLIGPGSRFRLARSHYHEKYFTPEYFTPEVKERSPFNALPTDSDFLIYGGIGFAVGALNPVHDVTLTRVQGLLQKAREHAQQAGDMARLQQLQTIHAELLAITTHDAVQFGKLARLAGMLELLDRQLLADDPSQPRHLPELFDNAGRPIRKQIAALARAAQALRAQDLSSASL